MSMLIGGLAEDGFVALYSIFHREFEFCEKQEGCLHVPAANPLYKTEVRVEEGFEVTFGKLLSI